MASKEKGIKDLVEKQEKNHTQANGYVHIDVFLDTAKLLYDLHPYQVAGFKAFMQGREYQIHDTDFVPFLEQYLKGGNI